MSCLWNEINLAAPNGDFCVYDRGELEITDMSNLVSILTNVVSEIGSEHPAWDETLIFMALKSRIALLLPCDKFLQILKMVGHCLHKLVMMKLLERYIDLADVFSRGLLNASNTIQLPSRQQLEYLLIRTQGAAKLIYKAISYTEETFCHLVQRLKVGHLTQTLLMACSVMGRIRTTYTALLLRMCGAYKQLKPCLSKLKEGKWQWPQKIDLPDDLWEWLEPNMFEANETVQVLKQAKENVPFLNAFFCKDKNDHLVKEMLNEIITIDVDKSDNEIITMDIDKSDTDSVEFVPSTDIGIVQPRVKSKNNKKVNSSIVASPTGPDEVDFDETSLFLDSVMQIKSVKKMIFILELACSKKRIGLEKVFKNKFSKNVKRRLKEVLWQLKLDFLKTKTTSSIPNEKELSKFKKIQRKNLLTKAKADVISILKAQNPVSDVKVVDLVESDVEVITVVSTPECKLTPVRTLPELLQLFNAIRNSLSHNNKELSLISRMFKKGFENATLLKEHGESKFSRKLIFRLSKKMINHCKKFAR